MKRVLFVILLIVFGCATGYAYTEPVKVDGDSIYSFKVVPWKCVFTDENGHSSTRYYTRTGEEKARGTVDSEAFTAMNQGPDKKDYYEQYRTYKTGETRLVKNWYQYGADFGRKHNELTYRHKPGQVDRHGNWTYVTVNMRQETMRRDIIYYDEAGYDAQEDSLIDARIQNLVAAVKEQENPLNPMNILAMAFKIAANALYLFGLFILFMLAFRRQQFYLWFDLKATKKITPRGSRLINKTFWCGLFPTLALMFPVAWYMYTGHYTAVIHMSLIKQTCVGAAVGLVYCFGYVLIRSRFCSARCAFWELVYSVVLWVCLWAGIILSIYILFICLVSMIFLYMFFGSSGGKVSADDGNPDNMYATSWDTESQYLSRLSGNTYMDTKGNLYSVSGGSAHRMGDSKNFSV